MAVRPAAVLAPVVAQDGPYRHAVLLEEGERVVVRDLDGRDRHLRGVEPGPDVAGEAVEHRPDVASGRMTSSAGVASFAKLKAGGMSVSDALTSPGLLDRCRKARTRLLRIAQRNANPVIECDTPIAHPHGACVVILPPDIESSRVLRRALATVQKQRERAGRVEGR